MRFIRAYRFRLYPNKEQMGRLEATLETCRRTYNDGLQARIEHYKESSKGLSCFDQIKMLVASKNEYQRAVYSQVLQDVLRRLESSYVRFFEARKVGKAHGFPRFKPRQRFNSFRYPQKGFKLLYGGSRIFLSKIGDVRIVCHRDIEGTIKTCSIIRENNEWYAILTAQIEKEFGFCEFPDRVVGVDVGIENFATLSTGETISNPRHLSCSAKKLARLQRSLSRKKKGSANRVKARLHVAKCHQKVRRQRQDFIHKQSTKLAAKFGRIVFEKLNIKGMLKNHHLARHIADAAWNQFVIYTTYKAESAGGRVELINPCGTSQRCSGCGETVQKKLSVRVHSCPHCGTVLHRDYNAAINIAALSTK